MAQGDPDATDRETQRAVLLELLDAGPAWLAGEELVRALTATEAGRADWAAADGVARAVRDLAAAGLVHQLEGFVQVTVAARRCTELLDGA